MAISQETAVEAKRLYADGRGGMRVVASLLGISLRQVQTAINPELRKSLDRDYTRRWAADNPEKNRARHARWAANNREHINAYQRACRRAKKLGIPINEYRQREVAA